MNPQHFARIAADMGLIEPQVRAVAGLLADECTVPFIARYRKEMTGGLDEVAVEEVRDRLARLAALDERRASVLRSVEEQGRLTDELRARFLAAETLSDLEDLYMPFRPKRRTRATLAAERGLEPLARIVFAQDGRDPAAEAAPFVNAEKGVASVEEALAGARDIIAEWINEDRDARAGIRQMFLAEGVFRSRVAPGKEAAGAKYRDYFAWEEPVAKAPSHRVLAMRRGEAEEVLSVRVEVDEERAVAALERMFVRGDGAAAEQVRLAARDAFRRLLGPSIQSEVLQIAKQRADEEAIRVFARNLRELLLSPPLGPRNVLGIDPGFRSGCKVVCLDGQGKLLHHETIWPHPPRGRPEEAAERLRALCREHAIEAIAIGNGTAGRETEAFVRGLGLPGAAIVMVNESGASVYSASRSARREFPELDVAVRGAVSIARRLLDPLAELVKIDPRSIGVGQYQHDVDQAALKRRLDDVVVRCVNAVGVDVNTASRELLRYVSGIGPQVGANIVAYRNEHGAFATREALKQVPRLGPKAFQQAAGFLRIRGGEQPLDATAVHPESYPVVEAMARDLGCTVGDLLRPDGPRDRIDLRRYVSDTVGMPTLNDILAELARPGRDPRHTFEPFQFAEGVKDLGDLKPGMTLPGIVTNVTRFGAFVDLGVHQDGLVHVSELADRYVKDPTEVVKVHQRVTVRVLSVDAERRRISLSMRRERKAGPSAARRKARGAKRPAREKPLAAQAAPAVPVVEAAQGVAPAPAGPTAPATDGGDAAASRRPAADGERKPARAPAGEPRPERLRAHRTEKADRRPSPQKGPDERRAERGGKPRGRSDAAAPAGGARPEKEAPPKAPEKKAPFNTPFRQLLKNLDVGR